MESELKSPQDVPEEKERNEDEEGEENNSIHDDSVEEFIVTDPHKHADMSTANGHPPGEDERDGEELDDTDLAQLLEATATKALEEEVLALEQNLRDLKREKRETENRLREVEEESMLALVRVRAEADSRVEKLHKDVEAARKDKEAMVMKYAVSEKESMSQRREKEGMERRLREAQREREGLLGRLKALGADKARLAQALDSRGSEVLALRREVERQKEEVSGREAKIKWLQNKLSAEQEQLREATEQVQHLQRDLQAARKEAAEVRAAQPPSGEGDAEKLSQVQEENNALVVRLQTLEQQRLEWEGRIGRLQVEAGSAKEAQADLQRRLAQAEGLKPQLAQEQERLALSLKEEERLRIAHADLLTDMEACRAKEAELLDFTQRVTAKNVRLQFDCSSLEAKLQAQLGESSELQERLKELEARVEEREKITVRERDELKVQLQRNRSKVMQMEEERKATETQLQEAEGEMQLMKRKNATGLREATREMQQLRKRLQAYEQNASKGEAAFNGVAVSPPALPNSSESTPVPIAALASNQQLDPQLLVQRIVKLQRMLARRAEKVEFLEEHNCQLTEALQKKSHLLQALLLRQEPIGLTSLQADFSKSELMRHGGVMASVYGSRVADEGLTLELSLEMNRRLQGLLEDTLLKNMTLKDSLNTLGEEISRLGLQKRQLQESLDAQAAINTSVTPQEPQVPG